MNIFELNGHLWTDCALRNWIQELADGSGHASCQCGGVEVHVESVAIDSIKRLKDGEAYIVNDKSHFRMEQLEAVLEGSSMKLLRASQRRSESSSGVLAMKSQNQSAFSLSHRRSIGLKSGE